MKQLKFIVCLAAFALLVTACGAPEHAAESQKTYTVYANAEINNATDVTRVLSFGEWLAGEHTLFAVCEITGVRFEEQRFDYSSLVFDAMMVGVKVKEVIFSNVPVEEDEFEVFFNCMYVRMPEAFQPGETIALYIHKDEDSDEDDSDSAKQFGLSWQDCVFYVTERGRFIPMKASESFDGFAGMPIEDAGAAMLNARNAAYDGERYEETQPFIQSINSAAAKSGARRAAKAQAVELPEVRPIRKLDMAMADLVDANGEFAAPGVSRGADVSDCMLNPVFINIDGHGTRLTLTFNADCALISMRVSLGYPSPEAAEGACGDVTDALQKARAAKGFRETLTAEHSAAKVYVEDRWVVIESAAWQLP